MTRYYTYVHYLPDETPFYIGKGKGDRFKITSARNADYEEIIELHGVENIIIEIIPQVSEEASVELETRLIEEYTAQGFKLVNIMKTGWKNSGWHHAEATKRKISASQPMLGKNFKHTPEAIQKIAEAGRGRKLSPEHKQALVASLIGHGYRVPRTPEALANQRNARRGAINTPEHNAKISSSKMGHEVSQEQREKQRQKMLGRKHTPEAKAKQIAAHTGKKATDEHRAAVSAGVSRHYAELREAGVEVKSSEETKRKISEGNKRRYAKEREVGIKRKHSPEARAKMSASRKAYAAKAKAEGIKHPISQKARDALIARNKANAGKKRAPYKTKKCLALVASTNS